MTTKLYPDHTLEDAARAAGVAVAVLWEMKGPPDTQIAHMVGYSIGKGLVIVQTFRDGGWNALADSRSNRIDETVTDILARCGGTSVIDRHHAQNALCLYEAMLDGRDGCEPLNELWENVGSYEMRDVAVALVPSCDALWHMLDTEKGGDIGLAWDFEFLPRLIPLINWRATPPCLVEHAEPVMRAWVTSELARIEEAGKWHRWQSAARNAAGRIWGYPELINDDPEGARRAYGAGEGAAEYVEALGKALDLNTPDPMTAADLAKRYPA